MNANEDQLRREYGIEKVHNCSSPEAPSFTSYIDSFTALPGRFGGLQYRFGQEYYFTCMYGELLHALVNTLLEYYNDL